MDGWGLGLGVGGGAGGPLMGMGNGDEGLKKNGEDDEWHGALGCLGPLGPGNHGGCKAHRLSKCAHRSARVLPPATTDHRPPRSDQPQIGATNELQATSSFLGQRAASPAGAPMVPVSHPTGYRVHA